MSNRHLGISLELTGKVRAGCAAHGTVPEAEKQLTHGVLLLKVVHIHIQPSAPGSHQVNRIPRTVLFEIRVSE